jgi:predicted 3-demethylubiquinone-9 3-methyltransferase (glyoxalase superfamily)
MTEQDRNEVKRMIQDEFRLKGLENIAVASTASSYFPINSASPVKVTFATTGICDHAWRVMSTTVPYEYCIFCNQRRNGYLTGQP